jgi:hypothetical protein
VLLYEFFFKKCLLVQINLAKFMPWYLFYNFRIIYHDGWLFVTTRLRVSIQVLPNGSVVSADLSAVEVGKKRKGLKLRLFYGAVWGLCSRGATPFCSID